MFHPGDPVLMTTSNQSTKKTAMLEGLTTLNTDSELAKVLSGGVERSLRQAGNSSLRD